MVAIDRGLFRGRRANLYGSRVSGRTRDNSSPGQSPDTSLKDWTHGSRRNRDNRHKSSSRALQGRDFTSELEDAKRNSGNRRTEGPPQPQTTYLHHARRRLRQRQQQLQCRNSLLGIDFSFNPLFSFCINSPLPLQQLNTTPSPSVVTRRYLRSRRLSRFPPPRTIRRELCTPLGLDELHYAPLITIPSHWPSTTANTLVK